MDKKAGYLLDWLFLWLYNIHLLIGEPKWHDQVTVQKKKQN
jgi:hypothetical protein